MTKKEKAVQTFKDGFACSQAVLSAYAGDFNLEKDIALKLSDSFGGGMGRMGLTCGAVTGAFMVIGLKHGRTVAADSESKQNTVECTRKYSELFKEKYGSLDCNTLLGCDISTLNGHAEANEKGLFTTLCPKLVEDSIEILEKVLEV